MKSRLTRRFKRNATEILGPQLASFDIGDRIEAVADNVSKSIELPKNLTVGWDKNSGELGSAWFGRISVGRVLVKLFRDGRYDLFDGVIAHELSHLSDDIRSAMRCWPNQLSLFRWLISEGKADHMGVVVGGANYCSSLIPDPSSRSDELIAYILGGGADILLPAFRRGAKELHDKPRPVYAAGYSLVKRAIEFSGAETVTDIHHMPVGFFIAAAKECSNTAYQGSALSS